MSNLTNDQIQEQKIEAYEEYLNKLSDEFLAYEFNDRIGCDPIDNYTRAKYVDDQNAWKETLIDAYSVALFDDLEICWINPTYLKVTCVDCGNKIPEKDITGDRCPHCYEIKITSEQFAFTADRSELF